MRNSAIIFIFFGILFVAAIVFAFIYLPKTVSSSDLNLDMILPVSEANMRYTDSGIVSFCKDKSNGIDIQVKEESPVFAPVSGIVSNIYSDSERVAIQVSSTVFVYVSPLTSLNVSEGDYVNSGDVIGYVDGTNLHWTVDNQKEERYECPYLYLNSVGQDILTSGMERSSNGSQICVCSSLGY